MNPDHLKGGSAQGCIFYEITMLIVIFSGSHRIAATSTVISTVTGRSSFRTGLKDAVQEPSKGTKECKPIVRVSRLQIKQFGIKPLVSVKHITFRYIQARCCQFYTSFYMSDWTKNDKRQFIHRCSEITTIGQFLLTRISVVKPQYVL